MEKLDSPIILVFYVNVDSMDEAEIARFMQALQQKVQIEKYTDKIIQYFIPIREGENRIACINPQIVGEDVYQNAMAVVEDMRQAMEKVTEAKSAESDS
jgi:hypothetical protein